MEIKILLQNKWVRIVSVLLINVLIYVTLATAAIGLSLFMWEHDVDTMRFYIFKVLSFLNISLIPINIISGLTSVLMLVRNSAKADFTFRLSVLL